MIFFISVVVVTLALMLIYMKRTQYPAILPDELSDPTPRDPEEVVLPKTSTRRVEAVQTKLQSPMTESSPKPTEGPPKLSEGQPVRTTGFAGYIHWLNDSEANRMPVKDMLSKARVKSKESFEPRPVKARQEASDYLNVNFSFADFPSRAFEATDYFFFSAPLTQDFSRGFVINKENGKIATW
jgi:hypothetical protein